MILFALAWGGDALTDELTTAWIVETAEAVDLDSRTCEGTPHDGVHLPVGLEVEAKLAYEACGDTWAYVRTAGDLTDRRASHFHVPASAIGLQPPRRTPWDGASPVGNAFMFATSSPGFSTGWSVDPDEPMPTLLPKGTPVEVLDRAAAVVRTPWGTEVAVLPWLLKDEDPLATERSDLTRTLARRLLAGLPEHADPPIVALPTSEELLSDRALQGRTFLVEIRRDDLTLDREITSEWLDPVGQRLEHDCSNERSGTLTNPTPCGSYWLDFSPFGAWWMTAPSRELFVVADGTVTRDGDRLPKLLVVVRDPFGSHTRVSPAWDGVDPGAQ